MEKDVTNEKQFQQQCISYIPYMMDLRNNRSHYRRNIYPYVFDVLLILCLVTATSQFSFTPSNMSALDLVLESISED